MHMARLLAERDEWPYECYGLTPYRNKEAPVIFWGGYEPELSLIEKHRGPAIIVWRGHDLKENGHRLDLWRREHWTHIASSRFHETELTAIGLPYRRFNLAGRDMTAFTYTSAGSKIFYYSSDGRTHGDDVFRELQTLLPEEPFVHIVGWPKTREEVRALMSECWLGLRLRSFDGIPSTVLEMASMGRRSVFNGDIPGSIPWGDTEEIVTIIRNADREADPSLPYALRDFLTLDTGWYE